VVSHVNRSTYSTPHTFFQRIIIEHHGGNLFSVRFAVLCFGTVRGPLTHHN